MSKVNNVTISIAKKRSVPIEVGQTVVSTSGAEHTITMIDDTENTIYVRVGEMWYGAKIFLAKFTAKEN